MIYNLIIYIYQFGLRIAALFSDKPAKMVKGHREVFNLLKASIESDKKYIWFHAASLGEFEQGRPLIEQIRKQYPQYKIVQTFFSPSGYEVRKNYQGADLVCYLPMDTPKNAERFVKLLNPCMVFFVKYEFWKNYLNSLANRGIPVYSVSSIFRKNQIFFKWYGKDYRQVLTTFRHLFVQNEESKKLLAGIGIKNVTVVGDTRFDRVLDINKAAKELPMVAAFKGNAVTFVVGSSWGPDEDIILEYFNQHPQMKLVVAPHVVNETHLAEIISKLKRPYARYTECTLENAAKADCLIIDCYGLLSSIYRYGEISYVGGGFGVGIHNVLEAAVYSIPVIFGPNNKKFREAQHLLEKRGGFEVTGKEDFSVLMDKFLTDKETIKEAGKAAGDYVKLNAGASDIIMKSVPFE